MTAPKWGNGSRVTLAFVSQNIRSSQTAYCYTGGLVYAGATQGELPEGQERVPWGIPVLRNSFPRYYGRHLRILSAEKYFTVGAHIVRPRNALSNVFRANNVRPYGYAPANLFDAMRRGRRTLRCTVLLWYI